MTKILRIIYKVFIKTLLTIDHRVRLYNKNLSATMLDQFLGRKKVLIKKILLRVERLE